MPSGATIGIAAGTQVAKKATAAAFAKGALRVAGRAMGYVGLALTAYDLYKMLENNDVGLSVIPDTGYILQNKPGSLDGFTWTLQGWSASSPYGYASPMDAFNIRSEYYIPAIHVLLRRPYWCQSRRIRHL
jgi:hypothetical protein